MAAAEARQNGTDLKEGAIITKNDLHIAHRSVMHTLERSLFDKLDSLFCPLSDHLEEIQNALHWIKITADSALDLGTSLKEENVALLMEVVGLKEKLLLVDMATQDCNIKFCGMTEGMEGEADLAIFMGDRITDIINLGNGIVPVITLSLPSGEA